VTDTPAEVAEALAYIEKDCAESVACDYDFTEIPIRHWATIRTHIAALQSQLAAQRERDGRLCALLEAAIGPAGADFCMNPELEADIDAAIKDRQ
jgi:hypothetical protein